MTEEFLLILLFIALLLLGVAILAVIVLAYQYLSIKGQIAEQARREFEQWRTREINTVKQESIEMARREMLIELDKWKSENEQSIRQDAILKSRAVTMGKITEHFIPYLPDFSYNPKDARFIGSPIDLVVFDGLNDGAVKKVIFVEVKTGSSTLSARERYIRDAIQAGNVEWAELRPAIGLDKTTANAALGTHEGSNYYGFLKVP